MYVVGFNPVDDEEIVLGEEGAEEHKKPHAALMIAGGSVLILLFLLDFLEYYPLPDVIMTLNLLPIVGFFLVLVGAFVWVYFRRSFRVIVTNMRIVEEYISKKAKQAYLKDYHYRFFESIEILSDNKEKKGLIIVHLSSGDTLKVALPKSLIINVLDQSRAMIGQAKA